MKMIVCGLEEEENKQVLNDLYAYGKKQDMDIQIHSCSAWEDLCNLLKQEEVHVIIIAHKGVKGLDFISGLKLHVGSIIWFSNLDFSMQAHRLNVAYFNILPITQEKIAYALSHINMKK